jgi:molecular chaperone DnaK
VTIHVFQGERPIATDNTSLGEFTLTGLPPAPRGIPKIEVTFDIDANGILDVTAKDIATNRSQSIRITGSTRLADTEKQRMITEAEQYAEADRKRREDAEQLNNADAICYQAEKTLVDFGDKLTGDLRQRIDAALHQVREALTQRDAALATERAETLKRVLQEVGGTLYTQATQAEPPPHAGTGNGQTGASSAGPQGRVVDAEYHETPRRS